MKLRAHYPRVSLLIPCFGSQAYVGDAIRAALSQSYGHIEVIVAPDDGDTYSHLRDTFKSPQLRIIAPGKTHGSGAGATRNRAIDVSTGDYIAMLDSDDVIPKNYIADLLKVAMTEGAAVGPTRYVEWDTGRVVRMPPLHSKMLSLSGFGQLLASVHPLIHRSLEPGYVDGFAEDVVHDGLVIAKLGTVQVVRSAVYDARIRENSACSSSADGEYKIQESYTRRITAILQHPTTIGVHGLSRIERLEFAELFKFRAMVSSEFSKSGNSSYNQWVAGREALLWDQFTQKETALSL